MTPIDLFRYADHAQKIPSALLSPKENRVKTSSGKILLSHGIDASIVLGLTTLVGSLFSLSFASYMVTKGLEDTYAHVKTMSFTFSFFPLMLLFYFFFWNFMNEGQSPGMMMMKKRLKIKTRSVTESLRSAIWSSLVCLSGGIIIFAVRRINSLLDQHDHLYQELISPKDYLVMNLMDHTRPIQTPSEDKLWQEAA